MITAARRARRGIVLTLDIAIAMMLLLVVIATAYAYFGSPSRTAFDGQLMRSYLQDAATVMASKGYLAAASEDGANTSGIREVLRATPSTVCMQVSGYGTVVGQDLAAYWKFDEDSGSIVTDSSGNGHVGTIYGGASLSSIGKNGHALSLDGSTGYASLGNDSMFGLQSAGSVSLWFKTSNFTNDYPHLISKGASAGWDTNGWSIYQFRDGRMGVGLRNGSTANVIVITGQNQTGAWKHVAAVWNGFNLTFYINGASAGVTPQTISPGANSYPVQIGRWQDSSGGYYSGSIDDVRIYSRALTDSEVRLIYSNPTNLLYSVDKPECTFSGGEVQTLTVPFATNTNQEENNYYYATFKAWPMGAGK